MVRYFMTIREACDLVVTGGKPRARPDAIGDVGLCPQYGAADQDRRSLAERLIRLRRLEPGRDVEIVFTGVRPGERLHEILFAS